MSDPPIIREAIEADAAQLCRFMAALAAERLSVIFERDHEPRVQEELAFIRRMRSSPRNLLLLAETGGEIAGVLDFTGRSRRQQAHVGSVGLSVTRRSRGRGIGTQLLSALITWARQQGILRIELEVFANNLPAIRLYERMGFAHEGRRASAVQIDDSRCDVLLLALLLSPHGPA